MADSAPPSPAQPIFAWSQGPRNFQIYVRPGVMARLGTESWVAFKRIPRRGLEIGGVLLGRTERKQDSTTFWIEGFAAVESEHRSGPSYVLSESDLVHLQEEIYRNSSASIGIFRSQTRSEQLVLQEPDTALLERYFDPGDSLFLMVGPVPGKAALFLRTNGSVSGVHEFPLASLTSVLKGSPNLRSQETDPPPIPSPEIRGAVTRVVRQLDAPKIEMQVATAPPLDRPAAIPPLITHEPLLEAPEKRDVEPIETVLSVKPAGSSGIRRGPWILAAALAILLVTAALTVRSYSAPRIAVPARSALEYIQLGVEREGSSLRVRWDGNSPMLRDATRAVLHVQDGDIQIDRILTASDLSAGSAAYEPKNSDLAFRLDVYSANPHATGQLQVMNLASPPEIPQARPLEARIQPDPRATPDVRGPVLKPVVNVEPVAKADEVSEIPAPVSKPADGTKPEAPQAEPRRSDQAETKAPDVPVSSAPKVSEKSPTTTVAVTTERAAPTTIPTTDIPTTNIPTTNIPTPNISTPNGPSVSVLAEPVSSRLGHVVGKVPLLRRLKGHDNVAAPVPVYQAQPSLKLPNQQHVTEPVSVDVKVDVTESGKVSAAEIVAYGEPPNFSLANAALAAARQWTFMPARTEDLPVSSQVVLHFRFNP
jgi:TonB family protein